MGFSCTSEGSSPCCLPPVPLPASKWMASGWNSKEGVCVSASATVAQSWDGVMLCMTGSPENQHTRYWYKNKSGGCLYVWLSFLCIVKRVPFTSDVRAGNDITSELTAFQLHVGNKSQMQLSFVAVDHNKLHRYWCTKWTQSRIKVSQLLVW